MVIRRIRVYYLHNLQNMVIIYAHIQVFVQFFGAQFLVSDILIKLKTEFNTVLETLLAVETWSDE
jgi:hypothetical protein